MNIYAIRFTPEGNDMGYVKARNVSEGRAILLAGIDNPFFWSRLHTEVGEPKYGLHFVGRVPEGYDDSPGVVN